LEASLMTLELTARTIVMAGPLALLLCGPGCHRRNESIDRQAIERLHQLDVEATFTNSADELAKLWDNDAVRLQAGGPAEVGKTQIYTDDKRWEDDPKRSTMLSGKYDIEDLQLAGDWAFEWGYFTATVRESSGNTVNMRGKMLRVMKRQSDGSWTFARVMSVLDSRE
jgi:ketosteroid isomerase-like protein